MTPLLTSDFGIRLNQPNSEMSLSRQGAEKALVTRHPAKIALQTIRQTSPKNHKKALTNQSKKWPNHGDTQQKPILRQIQTLPNHGDTQQKSISDPSKPTKPRDTQPPCLGFILIRETGLGRGGGASQGFRQGPCKYYIRNLPSQGSVFPSVFPRRAHGMNIYIYVYVYTYI